MQFVRSLFEVSDSHRQAMSKLGASTLLFLITCCLTTGLFGLLMWSRVAFEGTTRSGMICTCIILITLLWGFALRQNRRIWLRKRVRILRH